MAERSKSAPSLTSRIIGVIGELLITCGLLIAGFIAWQLWWTGLIADGEQSEALDAFNDTIEITAQEQVTEGKIAESRYDDPPEWNRDLAPGETFGVMRVPAWGLGYEKILQEGTDQRSVLDRGSFGHYDQTAYPGEIGNFSVAAHRRMAGDPLIDIDQMHNGDVFIVETDDTYYVYEIVDHEIVLPSALRAIAPDPFLARDAEAAGATYDGEATRRLLTITTCHPKYTSTHRWITHAELKYWTDRDEGVPIDLVPLDERPDNWEEIY